MAMLYDDIIRPEGLLHFAGQHASVEHGWIEGAIESGLREAQATPDDSKLWNVARSASRVHRKGVMTHPLADTDAGAC